MESAAEVSVPDDLVVFKAALDFYVSGMRDGWSSRSDDEIQAHFVNPSAVTTLRQAPLLTGEAALARILAYERVVGARIKILWEDKKGERWEHFLTIEEESPHRIRTRSAGSTRPLPEGFRLRPAMVEDGPQLSRLEYLAPIQIGDAQVVYDHGEDYFAAIRLMGGESHTMVLTHEDSVVGVICVVKMAVRVGGELRSCSYTYRLRVDPAFRGRGLAGPLGATTTGLLSGQVDFSTSYVAKGNEAASRFTAGRWSVEPERVIVDVSGNAGKPVGRTATPADAGRIAELINAAHDREELFVPYTAEAVAGRLGREPKLYSWLDIRLNARAVVGLSHRPLTVVRTDSDQQTEGYRSLVLDYGFEPGAEDDLVDLLRSVCAEVEGGSSELSIFTSPGSPGYGSLRGFGRRAEPYWAVILTREPPGVRERGIYVDQLYF